MKKLISGDCSVRTNKLINCKNEKNIILALNYSFSFQINYIVTINAGLGIQTETQAKQFEPRSCFSNNTKTRLSFKKTSVETRFDLEGQT